MYLWNPDWNLKCAWKSTIIWIHTQTQTCYIWSYILTDAQLSRLKLRTWTKENLTIFLPNHLAISVRYWPVTLNALPNLAAILCSPSSLDDDDVRVHLGQLLPAHIYTYDEGRAWNLTSFRPKSSRACAMCRLSQSACTRDVVYGFKLALSISISSACQVVQKCMSLSVRACVVPSTSVVLSSRARFVLHCISHGQY